MKKVLVTGGLGYIGSHTVVELQEAGFQVTIIDNLMNSSVGVLDGIEAITGVRPTFFQIDLRKKDEVAKFFLNQPTQHVIHFAASKAVGESVEKPLLYYENNLHSLIYLLQHLVSKAGGKFIFSSSCTVYGEPNTLPITESFPIQPSKSPYGNTKQVGEEIIEDTCNANPNLAAIALRYFNPIGAHASAKIGELPLGVPQNLVPYITQTAAGIRKELSVFGDDYPTPDGTCIRDYIHVIDLAKAHVVALQRLIENRNQVNYEVFNIGTGKGTSVLEVIETFERVNQMKLPYRIAPRRKGDVVTNYADTTKANEVLGWKAKHSLEEALASAWAWEKEVRKKS